MRVMRHFVKSWYCAVQQLKSCNEISGLAPHCRRNSCLPVVLRTQSAAASWSRNVVSPLPASARHGLQRFGHGARPGHPVDPATLVEALVADLDRTAVDRRLADTLAGTVELMQDLAEYRDRKDELRDEGLLAKGKKPDGTSMESMEASIDKRVGLHAELKASSPKRLAREGEVAARFEVLADEPLGFRERYIWFWANHFAVSTRKGGILRMLAGAYEREAIRAHVGGRFVDMLTASATHPAMLTYLDGHRSIGPNSPAGRTRGRGLNENLAREVLELHTLGVEAGYTQADVTELARVLTGWGYVEPNDVSGATIGQSLFRASRHEPGGRTILGKTYGQRGADQLDAVLTDLAAHPATGARVARKLAAHFVADDPPPALVARLTDTFRRTGGDLKALARTLVTAPEAWDAPAAKLRGPFEWTVGMVRAGVPLNAAQAVLALRRLGHDMWGPPAPDGYSDRTDDLLTPVGMKTRFEIAALWAEKMPRDLDPNEVAAAVIGVDASRDTLLAVQRAESPEQAYALLFLSPEFQRR
jgi:uncharacterized protein (DUF1800 family)